jgi:hypothetical protein
LSLFVSTLLSDRDLDGAGLAIVSLAQPREPPMGDHAQADRRRERTGKPIDLDTLAKAFFS